MTDTERLDWLQDQYTLHRSAEILYVVDGYEISLTAQDGNVIVNCAHGMDLRQAIDRLADPHPAT